MRSGRNLGLKLGRHKSGDSKQGQRKEDKWKEEGKGKVRSGRKS